MAASRVIYLAMCKTVNDDDWQPITKVPFQFEFAANNAIKYYCGPNPPYRYLVREITITVHDKEIFPDKSDEHETKKYTPLDGNPYAGLYYFNGEDFHPVE